MNAVVKSLQMSEASSKYLMFHECFYSRLFFSKVASKLGSVLTSKSGTDVKLQ